MGRKARSPKHRAPEVQRSAVRAWRERLRDAYGATTLAYLEVKRPEIHRAYRQLSQTRPTLAGKRVVAEVIRYGRAGVQLSPEEESKIPEKTERSNLQRKRDHFSTALDRLFTEKLLAEIKVSDVLAAAGTSSYAFYSVFRSGIPGAFCHWARGHLDVFAKDSRELIARGRRERWSLKEILNEWVTRFATFVDEIPNGRRPMLAFLLYEIDNVGAGLVTKLPETRRHQQEYEERRAVVGEFAQIAADLHRAGARVLHELQQVFLDAPESARFRLARRLWKGPESVAWNLSMSLWQITSVSLIARGLIEAEQQDVNHRSLLFEVWCRAVTGE